MECQGGDLIVMFSNENVDFVCCLVLPVANFEKKWMKSPFRRSWWSFLQTSFLQVLEGGSVFPALP